MAGVHQRDYRVAEFRSSYPALCSSPAQDLRPCSRSATSARLAAASWCLVERRGGLRDHLPADLVTSSPPGASARVAAFLCRRYRSLQVLSAAAAARAAEALAGMQRAFGSPRRPGLTSSPG